MQNFQFIEINNALEAISSLTSVMWCDDKLHLFQASTGNTFILRGERAKQVFEALKAISL